MVPVSAQSFERTTHNEATDSVSLTAGAQRREYKRPYALGEVPVKVLSDGGSTPPISTKGVLNKPYYFKNGFAVTVLLTSLDKGTQPFVVCDG